MVLKSKASGRNLWLLAGAASLAACGGGGSSGSTRPSPTPTPTPTPTPAPRSTATQQELTQETNRSNFVLTSGADHAHERGFTGAGELVAIMDTGALSFLQNLDDNSGTGPDADDLVFEDRLHPESKKLWGDDTPDDFTQHGTIVTAVIGAARDGRGITGVAYGADLLYYDYGDYCLDSYCDEDDWQESFERYRVGMQEAIDLGATVMNFSLSEERFPVRMIPTVANAVAADMVMVMSAGNDSDPDPSPMAVELARMAPDHTIIAGALQPDNITPASFTAFAGVAMDNYLMAQGVSVRTYDNDGNLIPTNGTSLSAPIISGAVALLAEAFPNLTGADIVDILFDSAIDAGDPGVDPIYGQGILDIEAAFQPLGTTSVAGSGREALSLFGNHASPAMGDASGMLEGVTITDKYDRAFSADLGGFASRAGLATPLRGLAQQGVEAKAIELGGHRFGFATVERPSVHGEADEKRILSAEIDLKIAEAWRLGLTMGQGIDRSTQGEAVQANFLTDGASQRSGFHATDMVGASVQHRLDSLELVAGMETGRVDRAELPWVAQEQDRYRRMSIGAARDVGPVALRVGITRLEEEETILGGSLAMLSDGAISHFLDLGAAVELGRWTLAGEWRRGRTEARGRDALFTGGRLDSQGWAVALGKGPFGLRVSQPLRVENGGLMANAPTSFDYVTMTPGTELRLVSLTPSGREIDVEATYGWSVLGGRLDANAFWRREPGHIAAMPDDKGVALRFRKPLR
ncbi:S8 family peptidase [Sphingomicrobium clamense]|uniref:S8 family serine peptidase n=1 Tax=Sphingomicrobium clamense TaxID=2851013 RepID=A0ABS6V383_9SPHN|nr:S8 family peptidase [Sphingomicrobium sp. B8]MBW0144017.1 S8 family serine peptidase [Sphingomicrobium sp. B8]